MSAAPLLFDRIIDDAAMFPPGNADAATAISEHLRYRAAPIHRYVGPLLVHIDRWLELAAAHAAVGSPSIDVVVLGTATPPQAVPRLRVVGFELQVASLPLPEVPDGRSIACEVGADDDGIAVLRAIATSGGRHVGKFRTGGTTPEAFPDEETLARVILAAVDAGAAMKFTAGLHHAIRFTAAETGFEHQGFLNVMTAVELAQKGADHGEVVAALADRDPSAVSEKVAAWSPGRADAVRRTFVSFGCCGVEDPIDDLVSLSLVSPEEDVR
jgi:hypothetical protein